MLLQGFCSVDLVFIKINLKDEKNLKKEQNENNCTPTHRITTECSDKIKFDGVKMKWLTQMGKLNWLCLYKPVTVSIDKL